MGECGIRISIHIENKKQSFVVLHRVSITLERSNFSWHSDTFFYWKWKQNTNSLFNRLFYQWEILSCLWHSGTFLTNLGKQNQQYCLFYQSTCQKTQRLQRVLLPFERNDEKSHSTSRSKRIWRINQWLCQIFLFPHDFLQQIPFHFW